MRIVIPEAAVKSMLDAMKIDRVLDQMWRTKPDGDNVTDAYAIEAAAHWSDAQMVCWSANVDFSKAQKQFMEDVQAGRDPRGIDEVMSLSP